MASSPELLEKHQNQLHAGGLTEATIAAAGIYSVTDPAESARLLNWNGKGPSPALAFPIFDRHGNVVQTHLRPDFPRLNDAGKQIKYELPWGPRSRAYFPPPELLPPSAWEDCAQPLVFVEGIKKALVVAQQGIAAISGGGVFMFHDVEHREKTGEWRLHPDLAEIPMKGRVIYSAFDGGDTTSNENVILAEAYLARMLLNAGADVRQIRIPFEREGKL